MDKALVISAILGALSFLLLVAIWWNVGKIADQTERAADLLEKIANRS